MKCRFFTGSKFRSCGILVGEQCDGKNEKCSFFKTEEQFDDERDRAILLNRRKENCSKCKYTSCACALSSEGNSFEDNL